MTTSRKFQIGQMAQLPDGGYGPVVRVEEGIEFCEPALYVTIITGLGHEQTRWVRP